MLPVRQSGRALVIHGGGPTPVMNSSLAGVIQETGRLQAFRALWGARFGIAGLLEEQFVDLQKQPPEFCARLACTTGSVLGSSRRAVSAADVAGAVDVLRRHEIRYVFLNGGNGTMCAAEMIMRAARDSGYELCVIGIPKTIDNDLGGTDHAPGYGSAARFVACAVRDIGADLSALRERVTVVETMGRNAGWLVAASALARAEPDDPPHLIYLPERPISAERIASDVSEVYERLRYCVIAISEGQVNDHGEPFGADSFRADGFGRRLSANVGHSVAQFLARRLNLRARSEKPGLLGRSSPFFVSPIDRDEAVRSGRAAVQAALAGENGKMVSLVRRPGAEYECEMALADVHVAACTERLLPAVWIGEAGNDVTRGFLEWVRPLVGEIEPRLKLVESGPQG